MSERQGAADGDLEMLAAAEARLAAKCRAVADKRKQLEMAMARQAPIIEASVASAEAAAGGAST